MAAGEYVSMHSRADTEEADLDLERTKLRTGSAGEHREFAAIYIGRGLDLLLANQVADQLMAHDALGSHATDELGIAETLKARPVRAALAAAAGFALGAGIAAGALRVTFWGALAMAITDASDRPSNGIPAWHHTRRHRLGA